MKKDIIYVTQPYLPPLEEFLPYLEEIWTTRILTNNGPFHRQLEEKLCEYLGVKYISLFANGTLALVTAIQALELKGEVVTTPFSFVATTHALWWNNIAPVFADIEPETFTLDPEKIEAAITPRTTAILPVHVYGYPCRVERIEEIARKHGLKVLYDAAHTFGARYKGQSICNFGDMSILSFHATKVFNTFEGGAIVCHSAKMKEHIDNLKNFGFRGETTVVEPGINAKMNEFQAAIGLLQLNHIDYLIEKRKNIVDIYRHLLSDFSDILLVNELSSIKYCYSYFPVFIKESKRDRVYDLMKNSGFYGRRYFYPLISQFPTYRGLNSSKPGMLPVAEKAAGEVICLPLYADMELELVDNIVKKLKEIIAKK